MSAEVLRKAAALMRERATTAIYFRDAVTNEPVRWTAGLGGDVWDMGATPIATALDDYAARHIASWHPAVALAVADWLDEEFAQADLFGAEHPEPRCECNAHTVARAYLGESS